MPPQLDATQTTHTRTHTQVLPHQEQRNQQPEQQKNLNNKNLPIQPTHVHQPKQPNKPLKWFAMKIHTISLCNILIKISMELNTHFNIYHTQLHEQR